MSQAEYCSICANVEGCNVILKDGEECGDKYSQTHFAKVKMSETKPTPTVPRVWIQRGDDGYWLGLDGATHKGMIHLDVRGSIVREAIEECCTVDARSAIAKAEAKS